MNPESIMMISEMSDGKKNKNHMISLIFGTKKQKATNKQTNKLIDTDNGMVVTRGKGVWKRLKRVNGIKCREMEGD